MLMKYYIILISALLVFSISCKTKTENKQKDESTTQVIADTRIVGKVSHQYANTGCNTVIIVKNDDKDNPLVLIPINAIAKEFDKDGWELYFNYRLLKIKNPAGCAHGLPAELSNISKK